VLSLTGRFLQYYRENANWLERTYAFVPRIGLEQLRAALDEDADGLDERMTEAVAGYRDPWREGDAPVTPGQFRTSLPVLP
jgi:nitrite reductase (NADH) large subunit